MQQRFLGTTGISSSLLALGVGGGIGINAEPSLQIPSGLAGGAAPAAAKHGKQTLVPAPRTSPIADLSLSRWSLDWEQEMSYIIHEALDCGINWLVTTPTAAQGRGEQLIGRILGGLTSGASRPRIATSCGVLQNSFGAPKYSLRRKSIERECEESLLRLQVEVIDLYQLQFPLPPEELDEGWDTLLRLRDRGLLLLPGIANATLAQLSAVASAAQPPAIETRVSFLRRQACRDVLPWCASHGVGLFADGVLESGILSGSFQTDWLESYTEADFLRMPPNRTAAASSFAEWFTKQIFPTDKRSAFGGLLERLWAIGRELDRTPGQLVLMWVLAQRGVTGAVIRPQVRGLIEDAARAAESILAEDSLQRLDTAFEEYCGKQ